MTTEPITESADFTERDLLAMLKGALTIRRARDEADGAYKTLTKPIRDWLDAHPGESLYDGESRLRARLQDRGGSLQLDTMRLADAHPALLAWAAQHGLLKLDTTAFKALDGKAPEMLRLKDFCSPGSGSVALIIDKEPER